MLSLESWLLVLTGLGALVGGVSICLARGEQQRMRTSVGKHLFVAILIGMGGIGLVAAIARAHGLPPLGLIAGFLVIAVLWEVPHPGVERGGK